MSEFKLWESFTDNSLHRAKEVADFLQDEFCPSGADIMWSSDYFNWKFGCNLKFTIKNIFVISNK